MLIQVQVPMAEGASVLGVGFDLKKSPKICIPESERFQATWRKRKTLRAHMAAHVTVKCPTSSRFSSAGVP